MKSAQRAFARGLASALLAGEWHPVSLLARGADAMGSSGTWFRSLVVDVMLAFPEPPHDARDALATFILAHDAFQEVWRLGSTRPHLQHWYVDPPQMAQARWPVPRLETLADVAQWLGVSSSDLDWLADRQELEHRTRDAKARNYRYQWIRKPNGGLRLLEAPKARLKGLQRKVLAGILDALPPHDAAHGFRRHRSVVTHARLHLGKAVVLRFDLRAFFAHVHPGRAYGIFRAAGYSEEVARTLIALCTNRAPASILRAAPPAPPSEARSFVELKRLVSDRHLPQGSPTSPALANLCAFGLDVRLSGLANSWDATYSRYADDLTFSSGPSLAHALPRLERAVAEIARDEGFALHTGKSRAMRRSRRQIVTGVVLNQHLNVPRDTYDELKAILHNCLRTGPAAQARGHAHFRAHLEGRISWVAQLHPARGEKLRQLFSAIQWSDDPPVAR